MMKNVITGQELQEKMEIAIKLLCGTVKQTLGPKGNNVILDSSDLSPYITNDGVTIAKNIESDNKEINTILEIAKESSIKTDEVVGDGTTTTLVLLESIFLNSLEYIKTGIHPVVLKEELDKSLKQIIKMLSKLKQKPSKKMLQNIALISANDKEIGSLVNKSFQIVKDKSAILIEENDNNKTYITHFEGYYFDTTLASHYFLQNEPSIEFQDAYLLMLEHDITNLESIHMILNEAMNQNRPLIIIAENFEDYLIQSVLSLTLDGKLKCCLLKLEEYGLKSRMIKEDLEMISGAKILEHENEISSNSIGHLSHIIINQEQTKIAFTKNEETEKYVQQIRKKLDAEKEEFNKEFYKKRISMFTHGLIKINISAPTRTECREKRMRLEDALCAVSVSQNGILPGSGLSLYQIADQLNEDTIGNVIWKMTLIKPLEQILWNAGLDSKSIRNQIKENDFKFLYNVKTNQLESISKTEVIDPYEVVISSLKHACSIATMLLTTSSLVINEKIISTYNENNNLEL